MSKLVITESKLKNIIKEAVKTVLNENNGLTKYDVYYCEDGGSVYTNGEYITSLNAKNDKDALKMFLNELFCSRVVL
jgi:ribosomal protein L16 Arg81 hydroxylase